MGTSPPETAVFEEVTLGHGAYFLANDRVYDLAVAFLNSFREQNPTIELCLIPFADDTARIEALASRYGFSVWADADVLRRCDAIGERFHGEVLGHYRKLAAWEGGFDRFVYIDCDTVVLKPVDFVFEYLDRYPFVTSHSDIAGIRKFVWKDSIYGVPPLNRKQIRYSANTGFVASRTDALDLKQVEAGLDDALALAEHMELMCCEQPLLNYLIVTSGRAYTSLWSLALRNRDWDIPQEQWAGMSFDTVPDSPIPQSPTLLVHWAGEWEKSRRDGTPIPHRELWEHYRNMSEP
jgi:hypothetical protein